MDDLSAEDAGDAATGLEIELHPVRREKLLEPVREVPALRIPVGEEDDPAVATHEFLRGLAEAMARMEDRDGARESQPRDRAAVPFPFDDDDGPGVGARDPKALPGGDELGQAVVPVRSLPHCTVGPAVGGGPGPIGRHRISPIVLGRLPSRPSMPDHFSMLLEWRRNEAATRGLGKLPHDFYPLTVDYLADVRRSYESDLRENPSGRKGDLSRQTYQRASQVARDIVEARTQKILTAAFQASIGGSRDLPNALTEERAVYDQVMGTLLAHRRTTSPYLETTASPAPPAAPEPHPARAGITAIPPPPAAAPAPSPGPPTPAAASGRPPPHVPSVTYVRIVRDGRPIEVGAETVDLRADDVLSLPEETARLLVSAKVAEPIRPAGSGAPVT